MTNQYNPLGLDLDNLGNPLNTQKNQEILAAVEYQLAQEEAMARARFGGGGMYYDNAPQQMVGYPAARRDVGFVNQGSYIPVHESSRESNRFMYDERGGGIRHMNEDNNYFKPNVNAKPKMDRFGGGNAGSNQVATYEYPKVFNQNVTPQVLNNNAVNSTSVQQQTYANNDKDVEIFIPVSNIYHYTLLPKRLIEQRTIIDRKIISERKTEKGTTRNIGCYYVSKILVNPEENKMEASDRFSENLFLDEKNSETLGQRLPFVMEEIAKHEFQEDNENQKCPNLVVAFSPSQLVNKLLVQHTRIPNKNNDTIYIYEYVNNTIYHSGISKNLFVEKSIDISSFADIPGALREIYSSYNENEISRNGLKAIDKELTEDFMIYLKGFTGDDVLRCQSYMQQVGVFHEKAANHPDITKADNIRVAIERFSSMLFLNIKKLSKILDVDKGIISVPRSELSLVTKNSRIKDEFSALTNPDSKKFYYVDENYCPDLFKALTDADKLKNFSLFTKVTLFTIDALYQIVKTKKGAYYVSLVDIYR